MHSSGVLIIAYAIWTFRDLDHESWKLLHEMRVKLNHPRIDGSANSVIRNLLESKPTVHSGSELASAAALTSQLAQEVQSESSSSSRISPSRSKSGILNDKMKIQMRRRRSKSRTRSNKLQ